MSALRALLIGFLVAAGAALGTAAERLEPGRLYAMPAIRQLQVSPTGEWIVAVASSEQAWGVLAQRRGDLVTVPLYRTKQQIADLQWIGDDTLFVEHVSGKRPLLIRFSWNGHTIEQDLLEVTRRGRLIDGLPNENEVVLWRERKWQRSEVLRGPATALSNQKWQFSQKKEGGELEQVAELDHRVHQWITDSKGVVRAALTIEGRVNPGLVIHYRSGPDGWWSRIVRSDNLEYAILPLGMTPDDERLIVAAHAGRDTRGIYELDPSDGELGRQVFHHPEVDVVSVLLDHDRRQIIAAIYEVEGQRRYHYLDAFGEQHLNDFTRFASGESVSVTSASRDHRYLALLVRGVRNPGTFYFFDKDTGETVRAGRLLPWVHPDALATSEAMRVVASDGTQLEAFLTLPPRMGNRPAPLFVVPRGGVIAARRQPLFDPLAQYVALSGVAVLEVNHRGSLGYGAAFRKAGEGEFGKRIEDDIDAAVDLAIEGGRVDPARICIGGISYGGYSALMSAIRRPDRYRCAISLNGPTDLPLMFQSDIRMNRESVREAAAKLMGDPEKDFDRLVEISPVYQVSKLRAPVLIAFGTKDNWVDPDHAYRFRAMLEAHGKPYEWLELPNAANSPSRGHMRQFAFRAVDFLRAHLRAKELPAN
ncbi:MAG: prolyl oligopeptidase family serine peptidase [Myxococcota bacterium]